MHLNVHPYIVFCGSIKNISASFVVIKGEHYEFTDPLDAIQSCFKICTALHTWPMICDYVWAFIKKTINDFPQVISAALVLKDYGNVQKFIDKVAANRINRNE